MELVRKAVILCQPRTGSNYLGNLLSSHPKVGFDLEYWTHHEERARAFVRFDPGYRARGKPEVAEVGVAKFFYNLFPLVARFGGPVIHLVRENPFDRWLSFRLAESHSDPKTGLGSGPRKGWGWANAIYTKPVTMDPVRVHQFLAEYVAKSREIDAWLEGWGGRFQRVTYEALVSPEGAGLHEGFCDLLGVERCKLTVNPYFRRQRQGPQSQFVTNYRELVDYFRMTPFAWCFTG